MKPKSEKGRFTCSRHHYAYVFPVSFCWLQKTWLLSHIVSICDSNIPFGVKTKLFFGSKGKENTGKPFIHLRLNHTNIFVFSCVGCVGRPFSVFLLLFHLSYLLIRCRLSWFLILNCTFSVYDCFVWCIGCSILFFWFCFFFFWTFHSYRTLFSKLFIHVLHIH